MTIREKISALIASGAEQLSRKYRSIGVPSVLLEDGQTYLDVLKERDRIQWDSMNERAKSLLTTMDRSCHIELSPEEFDEWLLQTGRQPHFKASRQPSETKSRPSADPDPHGQ